MGGNDGGGTTGAPGRRPSGSGGAARAVGVEPAVANPAGLHPGEDRSHELDHLVGVRVGVVADEEDVDEIARGHHAHPLLTWRVIAPARPVAENRRVRPLRRGDGDAQRAGEEQPLRALRSGEWPGPMSGECPQRVDQATVTRPATTRQSCGERFPRWPAAPARLTPMLERRRLAWVSAAGRREQHGRFTFELAAALGAVAGVIAVSAVPPRRTTRAPRTAGSERVVRALQPHAGRRLRPAGRRAPGLRAHQHRSTGTNQFYTTATTSMTASPAARHTAGRGTTTRRSSASRPASSTKARRLAVGR